MKPTSIFTVDLEDWYHANYQSVNTLNSNFSLLETGTEKLLNILNNHNSKATFFCIASLAKNHQKLIKKISKQGHEIASHSLNHKLVYSMTRKDFIIDAKNSKKVLEEIIQKPVLGYRAPSWSVSSSQTPWFWDSLKTIGYEYSSSLFPFKTFLYGDSKAPNRPHMINGLLEIPPTSFEILKYRIPFSGGFYLRSLPLSILKYMSSNLLKREKKLIFYIHPREVETEQPILNELNHKEKFIHYHNIGKTENKLVQLLKKYPSNNIEQELFNIRNTI